MTLNEWKASGKTFRYKNKYNIFYHDFGKGEPLLLLHGFPTASWDWHKILPALAEKYRVIALDFIGFGFSDKPRNYDYSLMDSASLSEELLRFLKIDKVHLLAHDYGATVQQELLSRFSERKTQHDESLEFLSACYLNGGIIEGTHHPLPIQKALMSPFGKLLTPFLNKNKLRKSFQTIFGKNTQATEQEIDEFYQLIDHQNGKYIFHKLIRYMRERVVHTERWTNILIHPLCPIRYINGGFDPISGAHVMERIREICEQPDIVLLEEIGHYPQTEAPEAVLKGYLDFRKRL